VSIAYGTNTVPFRRFSDESEVMHSDMIGSIEVEYHFHEMIMIV